MSWSVGVSLGRMAEGVAQAVQVTVAACLPVELWHK